MQNTKTPAEPKNNVDVQTAALARKGAVDFGEDEIPADKLKLAGEILSRSPEEPITDDETRHLAHALIRANDVIVRLHSTREMRQ